ncbi:MAG: hypothetical protein OYH77_06410 [Pseudomonadota bacterium]|nr:hypothetical protein [Pseudomonadota bacterium]
MVVLGGKVSKVMAADYDRREYDGVADLVDTKLSDEADCGWNHVCYWCALHGMARSCR